MEVKPNHPLAEIIAKKLFSIESVPDEEKRKMVNRACSSAVAYLNDRASESDILRLIKKFNNIHSCGDVLKWENNLAKAISKMIKGE